MKNLENILCALIIGLAVSILILININDKYKPSYPIKIIEGCQYLKIGGSWTHKGNCTNHVILKVDAAEDRKQNYNSDMPMLDVPAVKRELNK